jgi:alpha-glucosidase
LDHGPDEGVFMSLRSRLAVRIVSLAAFLLAAENRLTSGETQVVSPNGSMRWQLVEEGGRLHFRVTFKNKAVLEKSLLRFTLGGVDLTAGVKFGKAAAYQVEESYPWRGAHATAHNHYCGATFPVRHGASGTRYSLEVRAFDDGAAFRFVVPGKDESRIPDEATTFVLPEGCTVWYHDLEGHYEGVHAKKDVAAVRAGQWVAPPMTFKLPGGAGYASITEAALVNYAGMALQADGHRGFRLRLGHDHPLSYPFRLRYSPEEALRLSWPAAIRGPITTPWRVVLVGPDLNTLVNSDVIWNLCPPPDPELYPQGINTPWIKPGRAVWKYLDGGQNTLEGMKEYCRLAHELGFEHHVVEGIWARWTDADLKDFMDYARRRGVGIWLWQHSKGVREPQERRAFFKRCQDLGVRGVKIDFFDHEAKEVIDLYQVLLREAAEHRLLVNFHGANKPTGEGRTWPNELTREAVKGMEASKLKDRTTHDVTLPFTRLLAGPADYTPVHFGERRGNTTCAHQVASAAIFSAPLVLYAAHPAKLLDHPSADLIKTLPTFWDETVVLLPSEIGEVVVFARRRGTDWYLAILNGTAARRLTVPLSFLKDGNYRTLLIRDDPASEAAVRKEEATLRREVSLTIELREGGGFLARFVRAAGGGLNTPQMETN